MSVCVRFHRADRLPFLRRSLMSIAGQEGALAFPIICCQAFGVDELEKVKEVSDEVRYISGVQCQIINVDGDGQTDQRARLLNVAFQRHKSRGIARYFAVLDYDDIWFSHALSTLLSVHRLGSFGIAFGDVHCAHIHYDRGQFYTIELSDVFKISTKNKKDLFVDNFLPFHSYMYNTAVVSESDMIFDEALSRLEDYDLLIRVASKYAVSPLAANVLIGLYGFYSGVPGGVNTTENVFRAGQRSDVSWAHAAKEIIRKNSGREISWFGADTLAIRLGVI